MLVEHTRTPEKENLLYPMPGDAVILESSVDEVASAGSIGIIEGTVGKFRIKHTIVFQCSVPYRGAPSGDNNNGNMVVNCSDGSEMIATVTHNLIDTGRNITQKFWCWKSPEKNKTKKYNKAVRLWSLNPAVVQAD